MKKKCFSECAFHSYLPDILLYEKNNDGCCSIDKPGAASISATDNINAAVKKDYPLVSAG